MPRFLDGFEGGSRFLMEYVPAPGVAPRGAVLCLQALAEEGNLGRRVLSTQAARMASRGWRVWLPDLWGCGDSRGCTEETTLARWRADLGRLLALLRAEGASGGGMPARLMVWGLRSGCALAVDLLSREGAPRDALLLWQPGAPVAPWGGKSRLAAMADGRLADVKATADGRTLPVAMPDAMASVAGYSFRRSFLEELDRLSCAPPPGVSHDGREVSLIRMGRVMPGSIGPGRSATPALDSLAEQWRSAGARVTTAACIAEPFWTSIEPSFPVTAFEATEQFLDSV